MNLFGNSSNGSRTYLLNALIMDREMATLPSLYDGLDYSTKTLLESMCQGGFLGKNETEGWALNEDLADKTIQWQPNPEKVKSNDSITSKGGAYSIENHIAHEAKLTSMMRKIV